MARIKVKTGGCGITYTDASGNARHALKTPEHGPFECAAKQAARLVELGVAAYVDEPEADDEDLDDLGTDPDDEDLDDLDAEPEDSEKEQEPEPAKVVGHLDAEDLEAWDYNELKKLAADMELKPVSMKKADLIAAIVAAEIEVDEADVLDALDPDNELPELAACDPE